MLDMRKGVCAICSHTEIIDAPALDYLDEDNPTPVAVTHAPDTMSFLQPTGALAKPYGVLRMLVCRSCGFVQWFASKPQRIPIDETHGTKLIAGKIGE